MGINHIETLELLDKYLSFEDIKMCDLGNQRIWGSLNLSGIKKRYKRKNKGQGYYLAKDYFLITKKIKSHISIDLNGRDGSKKIDLSKPIKNNSIGSFNLITNFGTSEHVSNQFWCFKNIHDLCEVGGIMYHVVPRVDNWDGNKCGCPMAHCPYYYDLDFFQILGKLNGYEILENKVWNHDNKNPKRAREECVCIFKKTKDSKFIEEREFSQIPIVFIKNDKKTGNYT